MLELQTFGGLQLRTDAGERVEALAARTKCLALLAYLAVEVPDGRVPREKVAALLWTDCTDDRARGSLRMALTQIRQATDPVPVAGTGTSSLGLARDHIRADVLAFREALETGEEVRALELYGGEFLADVHVDGARGFQRWTDRKRGHLRQQAYEAALSVGASAREADDLASAEYAFRRALDLGPLREEAARQLIGTLVERGRSADALQLYESFRERRETELEMGPSEELRERVAELKQAPPAPSGVDEKAEPAAGNAPAEPVDSSAEESDGSSTLTSGSPTDSDSSHWGRNRRRRLLEALVAVGLLGAALLGTWYLVGAGGEATPAAADDRSVAVLPFEATGTEDPDPIASALHADLLTRLSAVGDLAVISATSVERFREADLPLPDIADSLGVTWVLEGHVQRAGDGIEVQAQLIDSRTDTHAWAETYRRELTAENLFDIQSDITGRIVEVLETRLTGGEQERLDRRATGSLEAHRFYVQGRALLKQRTTPEIRQSVDYFQQAIERDSTYALAWAGLADAVTESTKDVDRADPDSLIAAALDAAHRALELDPELAEAHAALGRIHIYRQEGPAALRELRRAVELRSDYAPARAWLGKLQLILGWPEEALVHIERAVQIDPLSPENQLILVWACLADGQPQCALEAARRAEDIQPRLTPRGGPEMFALYHLGRFEEMRARIRAEGDSVAERPLVALAAAQRGDSGAAERLLATIQQDEAPMTAAVLHAALGNEDETYANLEQELEQQMGLWNHGAIFVRHFFSEILDPRREDPRYEQLIRDLNRAWGLNPDGSLPEETPRG